MLSAQTLSEIANLYEVDVAAITGVAANGLGDADTLTIGQEILVPSPISVAPRSLPGDTYRGQTASFTTAPVPA